MKKRFEVTPVNEINRDKKPVHPSEIIPLINVSNEIPSSHSSHPLFTTINETTQPSTYLYNRFLIELKKHLSPTAIIQNLIPPSQSSIHSNNNANENLNNKIDETDSNYSTIQSTVNDTNSLRVTDKFLYELRLKRRELNEKTKGLPIEQRIALNRYQNYPRRMRAQDIFDIHFELEDDDKDNNQFLNQDLQETIRNNIFDELDHQRFKKYYKQYRQLIFGRILLMIFTCVFLFMSITLVYVVGDLYDRAKYLDLNLPDNKFLPMSYDKTEISS